jgi:DNA recombination protein RmuC
MNTSDWPVLLSGFIAGALLCWLILRVRFAALHERQQALQERCVKDEATLAVARERLEQQEQSLREAAVQFATANERLELERQAGTEKLALLEEARRQLGDAFRALSAEALKSNNEQFLQLAQQNLAKFQEGAKTDLEQRQQAMQEMVKPVAESLKKVDEKLGDLEKVRVSAYSALNQQLQDLIGTHLPQLHRETAGLVRALRQPHARGRWGELQLRRVVELAGMLEHVDFHEQETAHTEEGRQRPDMIVRLPGGKRIVVDSKAPVAAYLEAVESESEEARQRHLAHHARQLRDHMDDLGSKAYWRQFEETPEFVVMFIPGEAFFSAALQSEPELIERGMENRVIPATPTTLIALLKSAAYGWRQEALADNARQIADLGRELYDRISTLADHWSKVGKNLGQAVDAYNKSLGSLETRVIVSARRFAELGAAVPDKMLEDPQGIDAVPKPFTVPELLGQDEGCE